MGKKDEHKSARDIVSPASDESPPPKKPKLKKSVYRKAMADFQVELVKLQKWIQTEGLKVVIIFEGRDAAGKGGAIKRQNPRSQAYVAWSTMHGLASLVIEGQIQAAEDIHALVRLTTRTVLDGMRADMRKAAENLEFEEAARLRDEIKRLEAVELAVADDPLARQSAVEEASEAKPRGRSLSGRPGTRTYRGKSQRKG